MGFSRGSVASLSLTISHIFFRGSRSRYSDLPADCCDWIRGGLLQRAARARTARCRVGNNPGPNETAGAEDATAASLSVQYSSLGRGTGSHGPARGRENDLFARRSVAIDTRG